MARDIEALHQRLCALEDRGSLIEGILDLPMGTQCRGNPEACGRACTSETCPLSINRLRSVGDLMSTLIQELRWARAFVDEMEDRNGPLMKQRIDLRIRQAILQEEIEDLERQRVVSEGVAVLSSLNELRLAKRRTELQDLTDLLARSRP